MRPDDDYDSDDHHHRRLPRMVSDVPDRAPREGADRDHDHDRHQRGHRNDRDQRAEHEPSSAASSCAKPRAEAANIPTIPMTMAPTINKAAMAVPLIIPRVSSCS